jgi:hypothetical protein
MVTVRNACGFLLAMCFCAAALILSGIAWFGLEAAMGWEWALIAVAISAIVAFNAPLVIGLYFYAQHQLGWPMPEAVAFALPALFLLTPAIARKSFGFLARIGQPRY